MDRIPNTITPEINSENISAVRHMIERKKKNTPFYATSESAERIITDMDHFPYTRFFRGVSYFPNPIVMEREAGFREVNNNCYRVSCPGGEKVPYPNHCFETACSTVYPCYPVYVQKFSDKEALDVQLNRACIVQYR